MVRRGLCPGVAPASWPVGPGGPGSWPRYPGPGGLQMRGCRSWSQKPSKPVDRRAPCNSGSRTWVGGLLEGQSLAVEGQRMRFSGLATNTTYGDYPASVLVSLSWVGRPAALQNLEPARSTSIVFHSAPARPSRCNSSRHVW